MSSNSAQQALVVTYPWPASTLPSKRLSISEVRATRRGLNLLRSDPELDSDVARTVRSFSDWLDRDQGFTLDPIVKTELGKSLTQKSLQALSNEWDKETPPASWLTRNETALALASVDKVSRAFNGPKAFRLPTQREIKVANSTLPDGLTVREDLGAPTSWDDNPALDAVFRFVNLSQETRPEEDRRETEHGGRKIKGVPKRKVEAA